MQDRDAISPGRAFAYWNAGDTGLLLIHGFTSTPFEIVPLGRALAAHGWSVVAPLLAGHGSDATTLANTRWEDWYAGVLGEYTRLQSQCRHVFVVGQSLGGLLALTLAAQAPVAPVGVVSLAAPLWLEGSAKWAGRVAAKVAANNQTHWWNKMASRIHLPKLGGTDVRDTWAKRNNPALDVVPLRALGEVVRGMQLTRTCLPKIHAPTLILHGAQDHTAPPACAYTIANAVSSQSVEVGLFRESYHLLGCDVEHPRVAQRIIGFVEDTLKLGVRRQFGARTLGVRAGFA